MKVVETHEILLKLNKELEEMYDFNIAQFNYQPNPNGRGMIPHNKEWGGSYEQKQLFKKINQQVRLIHKYERKLNRKK